MGTVTTILRMVTRRSLANWRLLTTVIVGVVMSAALMSSVFLYSDAIRDLGLRHALRTSDPVERNVRLVYSGRPGVPDYGPKREAADRILNDYLGGVLGEVIHVGRSATFYLAPPGQPFPESDDRPRANFYFADEVYDKVDVVDGRLPQAFTGTGRPTLEVVLGDEAAGLLGVSIGDSFDLHPFWRSDVEPVTVSVVGFIRPNDLSDPYWFGRTDRFTVPTPNWDTYAFWTTEEEVVVTLPAYLQDMDVSLETFGLVDIDAINARNARSVEDAARVLGIGIRESVPNSVVETELHEIVSSYRTKLFFTRLPLFALMLQVVGIAIYYLVMVSTMLIERQHGEIALLRSRGASPRQVIAIYVIEGLAICGLAALVGPYIASAGIGVLGYTPSFESLSGNTALDVPISRNAFAAAAGGALLALTALLWPAWRASSQSTIDYKHSLARPNTQPLFLRYYLDLALVGLGALLFYQLREKGSFVTNRLFGDLSADPLLLLSPTLFMLMVALVFLRLFPLILRLVVRLTGRLDSPTVALGLTRMTRAPLHYSRLILLLLLATAVGMFAAGYRATLERGYDDRAAFEAGSPSRLEEIRTPSALSAEQLEERITSAVGSESGTALTRQQGAYNLTAFRSETLTLLGVQPEEFGDYAFWRDDFAGESLDSLMAKLPLEEIPTPEGVEVPTGSRYIGLWAQMPLANNQGRLGIRLREDDGNFWDYQLFPVSEGDPSEWRFFAADLTQPSQLRFNPGLIYRTGTPKQLESVYVRITGQAPQVPFRAIVLVDEVQVSPGQNAELVDSGFADGQVVESFVSFAGYELITGASLSDPGAISFAEGAGYLGDGARIAFTREAGSSPIFGLRSARPPTPLPVIVGNDFRATAEIDIGDEFRLYVNRQYIQARLVGSFDYFPGHDPSEAAHLIVADLESLQAIGATVPGLSDAIYANEVWMSFAEPGAMTRDALTAAGLQVDAAYDERDVRAAQAADPLIAASWEGILFLSFAAVLILTGLGFAVYAALAVQSRSLEFAILRTMGYSSKQVLSLVSFEQLFVIVSGVVVGTFLGFPLGRLMIGYLGVTEEGGDPVPPLISQVSWTAVLTVYGLLAIVFVGTITALAAVYSRLAVHRALRIGEI